MLERIVAGLAHHPLQLLQPPQKRSAAVLIGLFGNPADPEILLTQRAFHLRSHSGQVAFPGGMWEADDGSLLDTALRESHEEVALLPANVNPFATLPTSRTRFGVSVTPYVAVLDQDEFRPEEGELEAVFQAPVSFFLDKANLTQFDYAIGDASVSMPCYWYFDFCIWGHTLAMLVEMLNQAVAADIRLKYPAPEVVAEFRARTEVDQ